MNTVANEERTESLTIEQDNIKYLLLIKVSKNSMLLTLSETDDVISPSYSRELTLD